MVGWGGTKSFVLKLQNFVVLDDNKMMEGDKESRDLKSRTEENSYKNIFTRNLILV